MGIADPGRGRGIPGPETARMRQFVTTKVTRLGHRGGLSILEGDSKSKNQKETPWQPSGCQGGKKIRPSLGLQHLGAVGEGLAPGGLGRDPIVGEFVLTYYLDGAVFIDIDPAAVFL